MFNFNENYMKSSSRITFNRYFVADAVSLFVFLLHFVFRFHFAIFHVHFESNENSTVSIKFHRRFPSYFSYSSCLGDFLSYCLLASHNERAVASTSPPSHQIYTHTHAHTLKLIVYLHHTSKIYLYVYMFCQLVNWLWKITFAFGKRACAYKWEVNKKNGKWTHTHVQTHWAVNEHWLDSLSNYQESTVYVMSIVFVSYVVRWH